MAKRTMNEIERDYKRIINVVATTPVTSIKDIAKKLGLTESKVKTSLSKHPRIEEKIMVQLNKNKEAVKVKKKAEKEALKLQQEVKRVANQKVMEPKKTENLKVANKPEETADFEAGFLIDASIADIQESENILSKLSATQIKIILTSVTIKELEKMQKFHDIDAMGARHILEMAAENPDSFHTVLIDETLETPDDCIIKYCEDHKSKVTLLTSDKAMALKARMYGIQTQYFKKAKKTFPATQPMAHSKRRKLTLYDAKKEGDKLFITNFNDAYKSIMVISNGLEYTEGVYQLKIGDDVYLATKKTNYITFAHYQITSLDAENNCILIYYKRIYNVAQISNLQKAAYKFFMRDFNRRHDL